MDSEDTVRTAERKHYTVLWTFDANTATPLSRTRLNTATTDLASGLAIIHAEAGKLSIHPPPRWCHRHPQHPIHRSRGLKMPGRWLGLLDDAEAALFRDKMLLYPNLERPAPRKLWSRINNILTHLTADFQNPGLLAQTANPFSSKIPIASSSTTRSVNSPSSPAPPVTPSGPPNSPSPSSNPCSSAPKPGPENKTQHFLTAIQLATGAQKTYNLSLLDGNPPATNP